MMLFTIEDKVGWGEKPHSFNNAVIDGFLMNWQFLMNLKNAFINTKKVFETKSNNAFSVFLETCLRLFHSHFSYSCLSAPTTWSN